MACSSALFALFTVTPVWVFAAESDFSASSRLSSSFDVSNVHIVSPSCTTSPTSTSTVSTSIPVRVAVIDRVLSLIMVPVEDTLLCMLRFSTTAVSSVSSAS